MRLLIADRRQGPTGGEFVEKRAEFCAQHGQAYGANSSVPNVTVRFGAVAERYILSSGETLRQVIGGYEWGPCERVLGVSLAQVATRLVIQPGTFPNIEVR